MTTIRNSIKAIIRENDSVLLIRKQDSLGDYYLFPGGGQDKCEDMRSTLRRECVEEIGVEVVVEDIQLIREYIGKNHEFSSSDSEVHQVEIYFSCRLARDAAPMNGSNIDDGQLSVDWVPISAFENTRIYPQALKNEFISPSKVYCGDVN
ncbi:MAG TPA: NUDIX domain-containing protein [Chthoniobacterales bacterium]